MPGPSPSSTRGCIWQNAVTVLEPSSDSGQISILIMIFSITQVFLHFEFFIASFFIQGNICGRENVMYRSKPVMCIYRKMGGQKKKDMSDEDALIRTLISQGSGQVHQLLSRRASTNGSSLATSSFLTRQNSRSTKRSCAFFYFIGSTGSWIIDRKFRLRTVRHI